MSRVGSTLSLNRFVLEEPLDTPDACSAAPVPLCLDSLLPVKQVQVDFGPALDSYQALATVDPPNLSCWPTTDSWAPWVRQLVVAAPWWRGGCPESFAFFIDGSYRRREHVGVGVVLLVEVGGTWFVGRALALCHLGHSTFIGE